jgi:transcriptional regulator with XRE-family HTH domain
MAIGKRIKLFRNLRGLTQKQLGEQLGFRGKTSDVRMAQYEAEARVPKDDLVERMAYCLGVSPEAIKVPNIDTYLGLAHTLFAIEDMYGLAPELVDGRPCLRLPTRYGEGNEALKDTLNAWAKEAEKLRQGEITKEEYDRWRYNYPKYDTTQMWGRVPPQWLSDALQK